MRTSQSTLLAFLLTFAPYSYSTSSSVSQQSPECMRDMHEEFDEYQAWRDLENQLENHPNVRVHTLVHGIEHDVVAVTKLMAQATVCSVRDNRERFIECAMRSADQLADISYELGSLLRKVGTCMASEIFIEDVRRAMQDASIHEYFNYQKEVLNQFEVALKNCLIYSSNNAKVYDYTQALNPSYKAAQAIMNSQEFNTMSDISKEIIINYCAHMYHTIPAIYERHFAMLDKAQELAALTNCQTDPLLECINVRMSAAGQAFCELLENSMEQNAFMFELNQLTELSCNDEMCFLIDFCEGFLNNYITWCDTQLSA